MKDLPTWWKEIDGAARQWLIVGKGPSFKERERFDLSEYFTVGLNHVIAKLDRADVASAIDIEVVRDCEESIRKKASFLLMPRYPHPHPDLNIQRPERPLESYFNEIPLLRSLSEEGRLIWYALSSGLPVSDSPLVQCGFFSAEVMVNVIAMMGGKIIRTLGVDGGRTYDLAFREFESKTLLANRQESFDKQFAGIHSTVKKYGITYAPMTTEIPIRIFIGTDETQMLGVKVLQYSIRKHTGVPIEFDDMMHVRAPMPTDPKNQPRTGFSFNRFAIPKLAGYTGRAVYLDADMLVFHDFAELWNMPFNGASVLHCANANPGRAKQFSVLLLDCSRLKWDLAEIVHGLDRGSYNYDELMKEMCIESPESVRDGLPEEWNSLEKIVPGRTRLIHYTDMHTQPWVYRDNANGAVWSRYLREAIASKFISMEEVRAAVRSGYARPSLLAEIQLPVRLWSMIKSIVGRVLDRGFVPHKKLAERLNK
jgi:hypothetical protein